MLGASSLLLASLLHLRSPPLFRYSILNLLPSYKREAYRHSEFAPKILHDNGLKVVMKTDHPAIVSRYLLHEAQQAHYYGLPADVALASVTSTAAEVLGMDHRVGYVKEGWDAGEWGVPMLF